jgi:hypothetical protein
MHQTEEGANRRLLREKKELNKSGFRLVSDEKKAGEYRYIKMSRKRTDGLYDYAYVEFSLETVLS